MEDSSRILMMIDGLWSDIDDWRSKKAMTVIAKWIIIIMIISQSGNALY